MAFETAPDTRDTNTFKLDIAEKVRESAPMLASVMDHRNSGNARAESFCASPYLGKLIIDCDSMPGEKSSEKQAGKAVDKTADKTTDKATEKGEDKATGKTSDKSSDKAPDKSADKTSDKSSDKASDKATDKTADKTAEKTSDAAKTEELAAKQRESYKKEIEKLLDSANKSEKIQHGEGYYQVLKRMNPSMAPVELNKLAHEVRSANSTDTYYTRASKLIS